MKLGAYIVPRDRKPRKHKQDRHNGNECPYCGRAMMVVYGAGCPPERHRAFPTLDHIVPKRVGGFKTVRVCQGCNNAKGGMLPHEWLAYVEENMPDRIEAVRLVFQQHGVAYARGTMR